MNGEHPINDYHYPSLSRVLIFIKNSTQYTELHGRAAYRILEGFVIGLLNLSNVGIRLINETREETARTISKDWKGVWEHGLKDLNLEFF